MIVFVKFQTRKRPYSAAVPYSLSVSSKLPFTAHLFGGLFPSLTKCKAQNCAFSTLAKQVLHFFLLATDAS